MANFKFLKAFFLGLMSRRKLRRARATKGRRGKVFDFAHANNQKLEKRPTPRRVSGDVLVGGRSEAVGGTEDGIKVFLGQLADGSRIAIKKLDASIMKGVDDFAAEAKALGKIRHRNLLRISGFCAEGRERLIVYDFMVNMSVFRHLHGGLSSSQLLDWPRRMSIAIGAAEGLAFLHHEAGQPVVHGEVKSRNLLLDANFEVKWADYGLMRLTEEGFFDTGNSAGITGYLAPEYKYGEEASASGDVFGFGILLLELISGRDPSEELHQDKQSMWEWAEPLITEGRYSELVDAKLEYNYRSGALNLAIYVATMCIQSSPANRLTMLEVADLLKTCENPCANSGMINLVPF
jgi:serine/threonine protein kinase